MLIETAFICLALNTYHEAKNQSLVGQIATAQVVMNRVEDNRFPNTICEVVKEGQLVLLGKTPIKSIRLNIDVNLAGTVMVRMILLKMRKRGEKHKTLHFLFIIIKYN